MLEYVFDMLLAYNVVDKPVIKFLRSLHNMQKKKHPLKIIHLFLYSSFFRQIIENLKMFRLIEHESML